MKKTIGLIIKIVLVLVLIGALGGGYLWYTTSKTTGEEAVAKMNEAEKEFLEKLKTIEGGMSYEQIVEIIEEPDVNQFPLYMWKVNDEPTNMVTITFDKDGAKHCVWVKPNSFKYTHNLSQTGSGSESDPE